MQALRGEGVQGRERSSCFHGRRCDKWTESATGISCVTALSQAFSVGSWPGCNSAEVMYTTCLTSSSSPLFIIYHGAAALLLNPHRHLHLCFLPFGFYIATKCLSASSGD